MVSKIRSIGIFGIEGFPVEIEADTSKGLPSFDIVGLPSAAVKESKERVSASLKNCGYDLPLGRIVVNLAPADIKKEGSFFDLPIFLSVLCAERILKCDLSETVFLGELSLSGEIRAVSGVLPCALTAKELGYKKMFVPFDNAEEAAVVPGIEVYGARNVNEVIMHLLGKKRIEKTVYEDKQEEQAEYELDFADVQGQAMVKRAVEVAAAGGHNILLIGPPGTGKSMIAKRIPSILPPLSPEESVETSKVHSIAGLLGRNNPLMKVRPFRSPHHTISAVGLSGGGRIPKPGELSLADNGVLFLDELPEFPKNVLEVLRAPLEDGCLTVSRAAGTVTYPCKIMLVCAMNPCPCGYFGHPTKNCSCSPSAISRYRFSVSGPLLDRLDIHIDVPPINFDEMQGVKKAESSAEIRKRVIAAREIQQERYKGLGITCNAALKSNLIKKYCALGKEESDFMRKAFDTYGFSARAHDRILKLARTVADLEGADKITVSHLAEAVNYRYIDEKYFER